MKFSMISLAVAIAVVLVWLVGIDRYANQYSVSIESTELSFNTWPAPGSQIDK